MHYPTTTGRTARVALVLILLLMLVATPSRGRGDVHAASTSNTVHVSVAKGPVSVSSADGFSVSVSAEIDEPTPYLEIRFQLRTPSGRLLFQRTEVRNQVETSTVDVVFARDLDDLSLRPGAYPYEIRVRTETGEPREQTIEGTVLVHAPDPPSTPVALALRVEGVPGFDPQGLFVVDPGMVDGARRSVEMLSEAIIAEPQLRLSLIVPPVIFDEWSRIAAGYQVAGPTGVTEVSSDDATPVRYRETIDTLKSALATGRLELLDMPYADPDIMGMLTSRSLQDLNVHYAKAMSTYLTTLETSPSAGTAIASRGINSAVLTLISERDSDFVVLPHGSMVAGEETASIGPWGVPDSSLTALIYDTEAGEMLGAAETSATIDHLFAHAVSAEATVPVPVIVDAEPDGTDNVTALLEAAKALVDSPWAQPVLMTDAAAITPLGEAMAAPVVWSDETPSDYREEVAAARRYAHAFETAVGVNDPDAQAVTNASLIAQSRSWAGPDGRWSLADRGRSFSSAATRHARSFLDLIELTAQDVTFAGPRGELPLSIMNNSTKSLTVTLNVRGDGDVHIADGPSQSITLRPQENFHTVAVDLQSSLSSKLMVEVRASEITIASGSATVRASYLDRLAIIGGVTGVLLGLLYYIRRRIRAADAGKIP